jgi:hypothetical protein
MNIHRMTQTAAVALLLLTGFAGASFADTGTVSVVFTKGGFIVDVGGGQGVLTFRGKKYPFTVSGMSLGLSIGASTSKFVGRALNLQRPGDLAGSYAVAGAGGAVAAGARGRAVAERQRRHPAAQWCPGGRGTVGRRRRCDDHDAIDDQGREITKSYSADITRACG